MAELTSTADIVKGIVGSETDDDLRIDLLFNSQHASGREVLLAAHYRLMANKRYWYDEADKAASTILCVMASNMRRDARHIQ